MTSYVNSKYGSDRRPRVYRVSIRSVVSGVDTSLHAGNYAGYAHFGTDAANPDGTPPSSTVGVNLLPLMANPSFAPGTTGFTPPLHAGTYTFLIQQGDDVTTGYQFDMNVRSASLPEPGSSLLPARYWRLGHIGAAAAPWLLGSADPLRLLVIFSAPRSYSLANLQSYCAA